MKNSATPPNHAICGSRPGLVLGIFLSTTMRLNRAGTANTAGSKPITLFGYAALIRRWMRKNCAGPASAPVAHGTILSANWRWKIKGNSANTAKKMRYQISGSLAKAGSKFLKCHAHSRATTLANPTAGIHSRLKSFVTPSTRTTSSSASPNTGDGLSSGNRSEAIISNKNGRTADNAGTSAAKFAGTETSPKTFNSPVGEAALNFRATHAPIATKKIAKPPSNKNETGNPVSVAGILKIIAAIAANVSSSTMTTGSSDASNTASPIASTSTNSTIGHTRSETSASWKIGMSTNNSASGGNAWLHHGSAVTPVKRRSAIGKTEWTIAKRR